jgi:hypothetical protein
VYNTTTGAFNNSDYEFKTSNHDYPTGEWALQEALPWIAGEGGRNTYRYVYQRSYPTADVFSNVVGTFFTTSHPLVLLLKTFTPISRYCQGGAPPPFDHKRAVVEPTFTVYAWATKLVVAVKLCKAMWYQKL